MIATRGIIGAMTAGADDRRDTLVDDTAVAAPVAARGRHTITDTGGDVVDATAPTTDGWGRDAPRGDPDALIGKTIGRYRVLARLGAGGMGVVYAALDPALDRKVALKVLPPLAAERRAHLEIRLRREAQALARLEHAHVIAVYDVGVAAESVFVAMQLIDGTTLDAYLANQRPEPPRILALFVEAARGLDAAHAAGIVHRDVKPSNLLVDRAGRVYVGDFGLARSGDGDDDGERDTSLLGAEMTRAGAVMGTPVYMAPEQHAGRGATARSDQFSLCVSLWEALFGQHPFVDGRWTEDAAIAAMRDDRVVEPPRRAVAPRVVRALRRGLRHDPAQRWPTMTALVDELEPRSRGTWIAAGLGAAGIAGAVALTVALTGSAPDPLAACEAGASQLRPIWPGQAAPLRAAIVGARLPGGAAIADRVAAILDGKAARWTTLRREVCRAEQAGRGELQRRCLETQRAITADTMGLLLTADRAALLRSVEIVRGVPDPDRCTSPAVAGVEPPAAAISAEVAAHELTVGRVRALGDANRWREAGVESERLVTAAEALGYAPLTSRALLNHGMALTNLGREVESTAAFERAAELATQARDDLIAAKAHTSLFLTAVGRSESPRIATLRPIARASAQRSGDPALIHGFERVDGEAAIAEARYLEGAAICAAVYELPPDEIEVYLRLEAATCVMTAFLSVGDVEQADAWGKKAFATAEAGYGAATYDTVAVMAAQVLIARRRGDLDGAIELNRRALELSIQVLGTDNIEVAIARMTQAQLLRQAGRAKDALPIALEALAVISRDSPGTSREASTLTTVAQIHKAVGDLEAAAATYERSIALAEKIYPPDDNNLAILRFSFGSFLLETQSYTRGDALLTAAEATWRRLGDPRAAVIEVTRAESLTEQGRNAEAIPRFEHALAAMQASGMTDNLLIVRVNLERARWNANVGRRQARARLEAMLAEAEASGADGAEVAAELRSWLAKR